MQTFTFHQPVLCQSQRLISGLFLFLFLGYSCSMNAQVYSANFNSSIESWVNGTSNSWSRVSTGGVSNSGCLTSTIVCEQGQQQGSCINETNYFIATPSVSLTGGNTYQISIKCSVATASTRKLVLGVNTSQARSGATTLQNFGYVSTGGYSTFTVNYTPSSTESPYFVLWGEKFTTQTVGLWLDDFSVTLVNSAPTISLTSPANNSVYNEGASAFTFQASVSDAESNLSKVEFYSNGTKVGEKISSPYSISYIPTVGGSYSLTAKATDSYGANTTSAARTISFRTMPIIEFVTPDLEFPTYAEGPLSLTVNATDADGTVSYVDFYVDGDLVFTDMASPWSYSWTATPGTHEFNAVATDNHDLQSDQNLMPAGFGIEANTCSLSAPNSSSTTICEGASLIFTSGYSSLLTGTIQWQRQPSGGSWANISGATSASYSATLAGNYRGIWTFENGATCTTAVDTILVNLKPVIGSTYPSDGDSLFADFVKFSVGASDDTKVDWVEFFVDGLSLGKDFSAPFEKIWVGQNGNHTFTFTVKDDQGLGSENFGTKNFYFGDVIGLCSNNEKELFLLSNFTTTKFTTIRESLERRFQNYLRSEKLKNKVPGWEGKEEVIIPTVFYVFRSSSATDTLISNTMIQRQLIVLNKRFAGKEFILNGKKTKFRFCLASTYLDSNNISRNLIDATVPLPNSQAGDITSTTNGIIHIVDRTPTQEYNKNPTGLNSFNRFRKLTSISKLSCEKYLRIFLPEVYLKTSGDQGSSYNPIQATDEIDYIGSDPLGLESNIGTNWKQRTTGIFISKCMIGDSLYSPYNNFPFYNKGKTLIHEAGHYFGLKHTFQNIDSSSVCELGDSILYSQPAGSYLPLSDFVHDTPPQKRAVNQAPTATHLLDSCNASSHNIRKWLGCPTGPIPSAKNPMDYMKNICQDTFTTGQVERMVYQCSYYKPILISTQNAVEAGILCSPLSGFKSTGNYFCASSDSLEFAIHRIGNGVITNDSVFLSLSSNQYKVLKPWAGDSIKIRLYPNQELPGRFIVSRIIQYGSSQIIGDSSGQEFYFNYGPCDLVNKGKKNLFFGQFAGLKAEQEKLIGNEASYNSSPTNKRINAFGGSVTYNDPATGNLLWYSAGKYLWNKDHKRIVDSVNTSSVLIQSSDSSSQYGVAIPHPLHTNKSILFTVPSYRDSLKGFRYHIINHTNINLTSPSLTGTQLNFPVTKPGSTRIRTGNNGAIKVGEKITAIPMTCSGPGDYWIIVQGHPGDTYYRNKYLVFKITSTDTVPTLVDSAYAGGWAWNGFIKASTDGKLLVSTFTNADFLDGSGTGFRPKVYGFNAETGHITYKEKCTTSQFSDSISAYSASFTADNRYVYLGVNNKGADTNFVLNRGVYRFPLFPQISTNITGSKVAEAFFGYANTGMILDPFNKILVARYHQAELDAFNNPSANDPCFQPESAVLTKNVFKAIRTWAGLPNYVDALPGLGLSSNSMQDLGINPILNTTGGCCALPVTINVNVNCTSDSVFYKFRVAKVNGVFPHLRVSTTASDFMTKASLHYLDALGLQLISLTTALNGAWKPIPSSTIQNTYSAGKSYVDFFLKIAVSDTVQNPTGFIKTLVFIIQPEINPSSQEDYPFLVSSCCRKALQLDSALKLLGKDSKFHLLPNPANQETCILWTGGEAQFEILDLLGRPTLKKTVLESSTKINTSTFPKGIYQVRVISRDGISIERLLIE